MNARQFSNRWGDWPLLERLDSPLSQKQGPNDQQQFLKQYLALPQAQRLEFMAAYLQRLLAATLGIRDPLTIPQDEAFSDLGLDSLATHELRNACELNLAISISSSFVFNYPTLLDLARHFVTMLNNREEPQTPSEIRQEPITDKTGAK